MNMHATGHEKQLKEYVKGPLKQWYLPLIFGLLLILLGIYVISKPLDSFLALTYIFSLGFLFGGILEIVFAFASRKFLSTWGLMLVLGLLSLITGIILLKYPDISMITLPLFIGFWVLFRAFSAITYALDLDSHGMPGSLKFLLLGILGGIFGLILISNPIFAELSVVLMTALGLIFSGLFSVVLGVKFKNWNKELNKH